MRFETFFWGFYVEMGTKLNSKYRTIIAYNSKNGIYGIRFKSPLPIDQLKKGDGEEVPRRSENKSHTSSKSVTS